MGERSYGMEEGRMLMMGEGGKVGRRSEGGGGLRVLKELGEVMGGVKKEVMEKEKSMKGVRGEREGGGGDERRVEVRRWGDGRRRVKVGKEGRCWGDVVKRMEEGGKGGEEGGGGKGGGKGGDGEEDVMEVEGEGNGEGEEDGV